MTRDALLRYLEERAGLEVADLEDGTPLFSSGLLDSFSLVDLIVFLESANGTRISPGEITLEHFDSIARILRFVGTRASTAADVR